MVLDLEKKERMTYKDHVAYIEKVRPVLIKEREIMNSAEWKKVIASFRQMKKNKYLEVVPSVQNNWALALEFDYNLDVMKYDGVDLDQLKEEILKDEEESKKLESEEEEEESEDDADDSDDIEIDPEIEKKIAERQAKRIVEETTIEEVIEMIDNKKKEELTKKRIQGIKTFKKYKEWLDEVRPVLVEAKEIYNSDQYMLSSTYFRNMWLKGNIKESPTLKNNWSIEFTDSFLATEAMKEEYRSQRLENSSSPSSSQNPASIPAADFQIKEKKREYNINAKRKQEFISLCASAGMTEEEAEEYWEEQK